MDIREFWTHLKICITFLEFKSCQADPDIWMREATKTYVTDYWEYVLIYVDDCLVVSDHDEKMLREEIGKIFQAQREVHWPA